MRGLSDFPLEILLSCLLEMDVVDILCAERTCGYIRDAIATRHLWLFILYRLDQVYTPDLPPYVDPKDLSYQELRDVIVRAVRTYHLTVKGPNPTAAYNLAKTISVPRLEELGPDDEMYTYSVKVTPGGRYLFMICASDDHKHLRLLDLEDGNRCIWSFDYGSIHADLRFHIYKPVFYGFEMQTRESITVAAVGAVHDDLGSLCLQVLRLALPSDANNPVETTIVLSRRSQNHGGRIESVSVSGTFVVIALESGCFIIADCENNHLRRLRDAHVVLLHPRRLWPKLDPQIWRDHLIYAADCLRGVKLCAFSLIELMNQPASTEIVQLDATNTGFLEFSVDESPGSPFMPVMESAVLSISDSLWERNEQIATVSYVGKLINRLDDRSFVSLKTVFDPRQLPRGKWRLIDSHVTHGPKGDDISRFGRKCFPVIPYALFSALRRIECPTQLSRSGRFLVVLSGLEHPRTAVYRLIALDKAGKVIFPRLSENIASIPIWMEQRYTYEEQPFDILESFMEPYSGMLIKLKDRRTGNDAIELYYPA